MRIALAILTLLVPATAWANAEALLAQLNKLKPAERQQKLIDGAKKEGEVMLYSSSGLEEIRALTELFAKKYPFLKIQYNKKGGSQLFNVALMEFKGNKHLADVFWAGVSTVGPLLKEKGMIARYLSPERAAVGPEYKDKDGYWTATRVSVAIFAYHAKNVPADKVPRVYNDLLDPFWKGNLAVDQSPGRFTMLLVQKMGWEKTQEFHRMLANQDLKLHRGRSVRLNVILAGEALGALDVNADNIVSLQKEAAPLDYAIMDPTMLSLSAVAMPSSPPHPHAAALFYDFMISKDGQGQLSKEDNIPIRDDVEIEAKDLGRRYREARAQKKFVVQSPGTFDPVQEEKADRLYIDTLLKKSR